ncbi:sugar transporter [Echinicola pacifica]|uniref:non-specific protein-tyrosine kinase n=1 Tax=Echinicola pacifica TaxID=346377 RepID=A0A918Q129_9BACT|nr:tyrosine-protein kinase [Echinicola pacifica]GGZ27025.1 sugar transporter [Echinicola pacifica]
MTDYNNIPGFEEEESTIDFKYYFVKYARLWPLYLISILLSLTAAYLYHRYTVEKYEVTGSIMIKDTSSPEVKILDRSNIFSTPTNLENDILVLTSKTLAAEALEKVRFDVSYYASTNIKEIELYEKTPIRVHVDWRHPQPISDFIELTMTGPETFSLKPVTIGLLGYFSSSVDPVSQSGLMGEGYTFGDTLSTSGARFLIEKVQGMKVGERVVFVIHNPAYQIEYYSKAIGVKPQRNYGSVLQVSLVTKVVEKGRDYINALMVAFIEHDLKEKNLISENTLQFIEDQLYVVEDSLRLAEERMLDFKVDNMMLDVPSEYGGVLTKIQAMEVRLQELEFELGYYKSLEEYLQKKSVDYSEVLAPSLVGISDGLLNSMTESLMELSMERRRLLTVVNTNHPDVEKLDDQIGRLRANIFENINNLVANTEKKIKEAEGRLREFDAEFSRLPKAESNYTNIYREYKLRENLYNYLLEKRAEVGIARASNISDNSVVDYARKGSLIHPQKLKNYGLSLALGLLIPLGIVIFIDLMNGRIMDQIQLKSSIHLPLLGTIGFSEKKTNMLVAEYPKSMASESFRSLRSALFYLASEKRCKKILVTSSVSGEGKTFISLNLAAAMAMSGKRTCVLGMDLRKPRIAEYVGLSNKKGLSSYLVGKASQEEIVHETSYENLYFVPSGPIPPNPAELLLKPQLETLLKALEQEFEVIILDTPPMALVSETMDLLRFSDVNLYVVRQDYTQKKYLLMINDLEENKQIKNFYTIFNGIKAGGGMYDFGGYNYGYGYNYSYMQKGKYAGSYYDEEDRDPQPWWLRLRNRFRV